MSLHSSNLYQDNNVAMFCENGDAGIHTVEHFGFKELWECVEPWQLFPSKWVVF